jgi:hypothetical protein
MSFLTILTGVFFSTDLMPFEDGRKFEVEEDIFFELLFKAVSYPDEYSETELLLFLCNKPL